MVLPTSVILASPIGAQSTTTTTTIDKDKIEDKVNDVTDNDDDDDNDGLWGLVGLVGLLGLAGLAGLKKRKPDYTTVGVPPADTTPRGSSSH